MAVKALSLGKEYHNSYSECSCLCVFHANSPSEYSVAFFSYQSSSVSLVCFVPESDDIEHQSCTRTVVWHLVKSFVCGML